MNRILFSAIVLAASLARPPAVMASQDRAQNDMIIAMPSSARCAVPADGAGLSPESPITTDILELYFDAEGFHEQGAQQDYHCRWVQLSGHYRNVHYWHYRGRLYPDLSSFYYPGYSFQGEPKVWVENFVELNLPRYEIEGAEIAVVGQFYDLCRAADEAEAASGQEWINMGGPCHYGNLNGLMLRDVRIVERQSDTELRMRGEANRQTLGTLSNVPDVHPELPEIREAFGNWIEAAQTSEEALLAHFLDEEDLAEALADENDWSSFLTGANSPLLSLDLTSPNRATAYFVEREAFSELIAGDYDYVGVIACVCRLDDCRDAWPLFEADTIFFHRDYVCHRIDWDDDTGWSAWN